MIRACGIFAVLLLTANLNAAQIIGFAAGFADSTPGFWGIEYSANPSDDVAIASVTLHMPGPGFFDFNAPIFDAASSSGLNAADVSFLFSGVHPTELTLQFAPGSFTKGDRVQFAADIDGLGSKLGGALGAYEGVHMSVVLADGRVGSANFTTETSVRSATTVEVSSNVIPEPSAFALLGAGAIALWGFNRASRNCLQ